ncbi:hypothetical protein [Vibrio parahaemolyticus]|uniref:hypothetical protein n=1 Tax=Vibrio parahaemolyticus TaxID=670 RepID=UPI0023600EBE|nr:hypothetical protein [Vibrio parahaemolyticus]
MPIKVKEIVIKYEDEDGQEFTADSADIENYKPLNIVVHHHMAPPPEEDKGDKK